MSATVTYIFFGPVGAPPIGSKSMFKATPGATPDQLQQSICNRVINMNVAETFGKWNPLSKQAVSTLYSLLRRIVHSSIWIP